MQAPPHQPQQRAPVPHERCLSCHAEESRTILQLIDTAFAERANATGAGGGRMTYNDGVREEVMPGSEARYLIDQRVSDTLRTNQRA